MWKRFTLISVVVVVCLPLVAQYQWGSRLLTQRPDEEWRGGNGLSRRDAFLVFAGGPSGIKSAILNPPPVEDGYKNSRLEVQLASPLLSFGFYGWAFPHWMGVENGLVYAGLYTAIGAAGLIPTISLRGGHVNHSASMLYFYGLTRGAAAGAGIGAVMKPPMSGPNMIGGAALGSIALSSVGYAIGQTFDYSPGTAMMIKICGDLGITMAVLNFLQIENTPPSVLTKSIFVSPLLGLAAGRLMSGYHAYRGGNYSKGDALVYRTQTMLAMLAGATIMSFSQKTNNMPVDSANPINYRPVFRGAMGGIVTGMTVGHLISAGINFDTYHGIRQDFLRSEGILISVFPMVGAMITFGGYHLVKTIMEMGKDSGNDDQNAEGVEPPPHRALRRNMVLMTSGAIPAFAVAYVITSRKHLRLSVY